MLKVHVNIDVHDLVDIGVLVISAVNHELGTMPALAELIVSGELDLSHLPDDDEAAIAELVKIKGIGRWSAEIYLLFAEQRPDIWPAGDLAVIDEAARAHRLRAGAAPTRGSRRSARR